MNKTMKTSITKSKYKFELTEKSRAGKLYLVVNFAGGDADTNHPEEIELKGIPYGDWESHLDKIEEKIEKYRILKGILDVNSGNYTDDYEEIKNQYGKEIANLYDNTPNDPQTDYSHKCYLDNLHLIGYNDKGDKYQCYIFLN